MAEHHSHTAYATEYSSHDLNKQNDLRFCTYLVQGKNRKLACDFEDIIAWMILEGNYL